MIYVVESYMIWSSQVERLTMSKLRSSIRTWATSDRACKKRQKFKAPDHLITNLKSLLQVCVKAALNYNFLYPLLFLLFQGFSRHDADKATLGTLPGRICLLYSTKFVSILPGVTLFAYGALVGRGSKSLTASSRVGQIFPQS